MTRPKIAITTVYSGDDPFCPHCGADMGEASITLRDIMHKWPLGGFIHVGTDGYAHPGDYLEVDCEKCRKPSAVRFDDGAVTLIAARTEVDERLLGATT